MTVTVTLRERGSNAFLELRSLFIQWSVRRPARVAPERTRWLTPAETAKQHKK